MSPYRAFALLAGTLSAAGFCLAQSAISARSGLIQLTVGSVYVQDKPVHKTVTTMLQVKPSQVLRTGPDGYAEVLLTPGVFLRLGNSTSFRMDSDALAHTHLTMLAGSAMVECDDLLPDNNVSFDVGNKPVELRKKGLYRLEANPAAVATIQGELFVAGDVNTTVKKGRLLQFDGAVPTPVKFHNDKNDELYTFSKARSEDSAYATGVTSSSLLSSGYGCSGSSWYLMGGVGMYSYLPCSGMYSNAFGYSFIGLNDGYMWGGPNYYVPPYGLLGYAGYGGYVPYGGAAFVGGGGSAVAGKTGTTDVKGRVPVAAAPVKVPIFAGPNAIRNGVAPVAVVRQPSSHVAFASGSRAMGPIQSRGVTSAAGPSIGHVAAVRGGYSGAMRGGSGVPQGGYSGGNVSGNAGSMSRSSSGMSAGAGAHVASGGGGGGGGTRGK